MLINITGGEDMTLHEISEAANIIQEAADADANIIFGTVIERAQKGSLKVTVIATGFNGEEERSAVAAPSVEPMSLPTTAIPAAAIPEPAPMVAEAPDERAQSRYMRSEMRLDFDASDDGFTPNFSKLKDDLDVPAFLRKQMD